MAEDELVTLDTVAAELKVSVETARRLCLNGKIPWINVGTGTRIIRRVLRSTLREFARREMTIVKRHRDYPEMAIASSEVEEVY